MGPTENDCKGGYPNALAFANKDGDSFLGERSIGHLFTWARGDTKFLFEFWKNIPKTGVPFRDFHH